MSRQSRDGSAFPGGAWEREAVICRMETSLHRDLKRLYAGEAAQCEVRLGRYRIDAIAEGELIEVQHGPLAAIRDKVRKLLTEHHVRVVKPIIASKQLVYLRRKGGKV